MNNSAPGCSSVVAKAKLSSLSNNGLLQNPPQIFHWSIAHIHDVRVCYQIAWLEGVNAQWEVNGWLRMQTCIMGFLKTKVQYEVTFSKYLIRISKTQV